MNKKLIDPILAAMSQEEKDLIVLAAKVRAIVLIRKAGSGLKNFHCTLGPEALKKTPEELADEIIANWDIKGTLIDNIDGDSSQTRYDTPFDNPPRSGEPLTLEEFLKK